MVPVSFRIHDEQRILPVWLWESELRKVEVNFTPASLCTSQPDVFMQKTSRAKSICEDNSMFLINYGSFY